MCKKSEATSKSTVNKKFQSATKPLKKPDGYLDTVNSPKKEMKNIFSFNNIGNDEQWKEITFKIKLTEAEYILLMKEKSKNAFR